METLTFPSLEKCTGTIQFSKLDWLIGSIGALDDVVAGGQEGICPENAIVKPGERGREAALGFQI